MVILYQHIIL